MQIGALLIAVRGVGANRSQLPCAPLRSLRRHPVTSMRAIDLRNLDRPRYLIHRPGAGLLLKEQRLAQQNLQLHQALWCRFVVDLLVLLAWFSYLSMAHQSVIPEIFNRGHCH